MKAVCWASREIRFARVSVYYRDLSREGIVDSDLYELKNYYTAKE